ncbi:myelin-oligodendrocyte glycoprotein-like isoform X2 [Periophthalmus magnuspinnatus]|uniref:myelin-oligodendrocyte glycoprotein-like isoform X2 n=1 Tax=Periophthalmus magnuspinnatus TaxID=409849 RepID=UPI002436F7EF|nr:myelin-oligodendrocyte glycoprotein-like isoform X2 [Periophthalmus magnuspinnatus]XP_055084798.1 myelin-oligodendrocyte glycoprotein-like isoform X2 [Periophthalmus magnuspinnatus]
MSSSSVLFSLWIVSVCLSLLVRVQAAVIGPSLPVMALLGEDVILPCRCDPARDLGSMTVEWSRTDVKPAPSDPLKRSKFVHMYRNRKDDMDMKIEEYINRTQLFPEQFGAGNASLRIRSVRLSDNATYKCFVPNLWEEAYVTLIVREAATPTEAADTESKLNIDISPTPPSDRSRLPAVVSFVVVAVLSVSVVLFVVISKLQKQHLKHPCEKPRPPERAEEERVRPAEEVTLLSVDCPKDDTQRSTLQAG